MPPLPATPPACGDALRAPTGHLDLPFFGDAHRALGRDLVAWAPTQDVDERDDRAACRDWVRRLGDAGRHTRAASRLPAGRGTRRKNCRLCAERGRCGL